MSTREQEIEETFEDRELRLQKEHKKAMTRK